MIPDPRHVLLMFTVCLCVALCSCTQPPAITVQEALSEDHGDAPVTHNDNVQGPTDWEAIGRTLGCVFAPNTCE